MWDVVLYNGCGTPAVLDDGFEVSHLWEEYFDQCPPDWTYVYYQYWSGCSNQAVACTMNSPFGPSGAGNVRKPQTGTYGAGGDLQTVVTPPFDVPTGASEVCLRVYACEQFGGSWTGYMNSNWKIVESSSPGLAPFVSGSTAPLPPGGAYLQNSLAHGSTGWGTYLSNPCYSGPLRNQPGWRGSHGGGVFPGSLNNYMDLIIPASFHGKTCKVAWQWHPDWCSYGAGASGFALDDFQTMTY
jgi:hypothetical protein